MRKASRVLELDALRGLAAVSVVLHHNLAAAGLLAGGLAAGLAASPLNGFLTGRPPVIFFYVLSGFVLSRALHGARGVLSLRPFIGWVVQRSLRLGLPSFAALVLALACYRLSYSGTWPGESAWLREVLWETPPTLDSFTDQALLLSGRIFPLDNVLWSLVHEWRISLLLPLVAAVPAFRGRAGAVLLVLAGIAITGAIGRGAGEGVYIGIGLWPSLSATLYFTLPFALGMALETASLEGLPLGSRHVAAGLLAAIALAWIGSDLAIFAASAVLIWIAQIPSPLRSLLRHPVPVWLGAISFSLYLVHESVLATLHESLHGRLSPVMICATGILLAVPASWLFHRLAERPVHELARGVGRVFRARESLPAPTPHAG